MLVEYPIAFRLIAPTDNPAAGVLYLPTSRFWRSPRFWPTLAITAVVVLGIGLRFYHLGSRGLWLDEISQSDVAHVSHRDLLAFTQRDDQMPLFNVVTWAISRLVHENEFFLRLPSAIAGSLGVYAMYRLGHALGGFRLGFVSGLLMAVMVFPVWYAQDARPYALFITVSAAQLLFAWQAVARASRLDWGGLVLVTAVALYTHYLGLLTTAAVGVFIGSLAIRERRLRTPALISAGVVVIAYLPWLPTLIAYLQGKSHADIGKIGGTAGLSSALIVPEAFGLTGAVLIFFFVGLMRAGISWRDRRGWLLLSWTLVPLLALTVRLHTTVLTLWPRYLSFLFPPAVLLVGLGADTAATAIAALLRRSGPARLQAAFGPTVGLSAAVIVLLAQLGPGLNQSYHTVKDQYREAVSQVVATSPPDSIIIAGTGYRSWIVEAFPYYLIAQHSPILVALSSDLGPEPLARLRSGGGMVWVAFPNSLDPDGMRRMDFIASGAQLPDVSRLDNSELQITSLVGVTLVREASPSGTPVAQAITLLRWLSQVDPDVGPQLAQLETLRPAA
jgi:mannosyltransferase